MDRRSFLKQAGAAAGWLGGGWRMAPAAAGSPGLMSRASEVVVVGAGAFGGWTALHLRQLGASVTLLDAYGPGNSRSTSGDESRGIRSSYSDRLTWVRLAHQAIGRWKEWDREWARPFRMQLFFPTGDLILRANPEPIITATRASWDTLGVAYQTPSVDDVRREYPQINCEGMTLALLETNAGVVRARRSCEVVAEAFRKEGGTLRIARAALGPAETGRMSHVVLDNGETLGADLFVFACGPWLPKVLPDVMTDRLRTPLGRVVYFGTPPGDQRFTFPNLPSFNFPGVTGWPGLGPDNRGFRVRGGGGGRNRGADAGTQGNAANPPDPPRDPVPPEQLDPDRSSRWVPPESLVGPRTFLGERFPALKDAPIVATHACHYESSVDRNPIVDRYPGLSNVWIAGGGSAEGFKLGPVIGEYIARRVLGKSTEAALDEAFRLKEEKFES